MSMMNGRDRCELITRCGCIAIFLAIAAVPGRGVAQTVAGASPLQAVAQDWGQERGDEARHWSEWATAFGSLDGVRPSLHERGIDLSAGYLQETSGNPTGGASRGVETAHELNLGASLDLAKILRDPGGRANLTLTYRFGGDLSARHLHNFAHTQEIFAGGTGLRIEDLSVTQGVAAGRVRLKLGWSPPGGDFATDPLACQFQNNAFCGHTDATIAGDRVKRDVALAALAPFARLVPPGSVRIASMASDPVLVNVAF